MARAALILPALEIGLFQSRLGRAQAAVRPCPARCAGVPLGVGVTTANPHRGRCGEQLQRDFGRTRRVLFGARREARLSCMLGFVLVLGILGWRLRRLEPRRLWRFPMSRRSSSPHPMASGYAVRWRKTRRVVGRVDQLSRIRTKRRHAQSGQCFRRRDLHLRCAHPIRFDLARAGDQESLARFDRLDRSGDPSGPVAEIGRSIGQYNRHQNLFG
jgi:hypothetical protein